MTDFKQLTIDELRDRYTDIKMRCARLEDALDIVNRATDKLKGLYQTAEKRAEKAETEAKNLRKAHLYMFVDGEELTISQLFDRYTEIKARCDRLEKAREETKAETKRLGDQLIEAVCCREFAVNWFHRMDTECELCSHVEDTADCEASNYECGLCKADCHCRDCKEDLEGRSNWEFVGWDKVLHEG